MDTPDLGSSQTRGSLSEQFYRLTPRCDPARLVWGPENEPFKAPGDGGYVADACNGSWYGGGRRWGPGAREAARLCRSGGGGRRRRARDEYLANNILHLAK